MRGMTRSFWRGFIVSSMGQQLVEDWYGLERYSELMHKHWVNIHWAVWALLFLAACIYEAIDRVNSEGR